jgi:Concanavalin A-like lectin/glucanases superfamily
VGWWKLDESSGSTLADSSGDGNTFAATGTTVTTGKIGNGRSLTGTDTIDQTSSSAQLQSLSQFTISLWVNTTSLSSAGQTQFLNESNFPNSGFEIFDNGPSSPDVVFRVMNGSGSDIDIPRASVNDGKWHLLTGTYDGTTQAFYLDGVLKGSQAAGYTAVGGTWFVHLAAPPSGSVIDDDVRIYNRALSATEVQALNGCTNPAGQEGDLIYNSDHNVEQYCDGPDWVAIGNPN